ncbi:MAG: putative nucleotidyltransferase substrate binding domain-containing protein [Propioniciclava sp.]|uniref:putative nucleotidyltransferase substrate binding domain-containing protein n=1 Tax=Propioniciclava sp. TaxID=2038686 RepID=UPI0039E6FDE4
MDVELVEIRDFLAAHHPFDQLDPARLNELPAQLVARYYRRGTTIVEVGAHNEYLYILRSGSVDIVDAQGALTDRAGIGDSFGLSSVMTGGPSLFTLTAHEDSLLLLMPSAVFRQLMATSEPFSRHFLQQQAGRIKAAIEAVRVDEAGSAILRTRVRDIIRKKPITIAPDATIQQAAQYMTVKGVSALLITENDAMIGIVTDRDLRSKVTATGFPTTRPVSTIMTRNPTSVHPDTLAFEVLVAMTQNRWHHLPVLEDGRLLGMITSGDLMRLEQANPSYLVGRIARQDTLEGLIEASGQISTVVTQAVIQDATADDISRVITAITDAITRKLIELAEAEIGRPPAQYCWVALGSQGRFEAGLQSDQDNAIIIADDATDEQLEWFGRLAERVVDGLEACGYERCPGDMMASNPQWRVRRTQWWQYFTTWMNAPEPDALLNAQTFFDMRPVHGNRALFDSLHSAILSRTPGSTRFLAYLAKQAQRFEPPLGFFRDFVLEDSGEHANMLDLKAGGIVPIVQMARLFALSKGEGPFSTQERLKIAGEVKALSAENAADLSDAFEFINHVRIRHQVRQLKQGETPDNYVPPAVLSSFERRHLKDAFTIIRTMQKALAYVHRTDVTS